LIENPLVQDVARVQDGVGPKQMGAGGLG
jgi:hypothetical protein